MTDSERKRLRYREYKAGIEVRDSIGTPQQMRTTWIGDSIESIIKAAEIREFERGHTIIIEIVPAGNDFTEGLFTEA